MAVCVSQSHASRTGWHNNSVTDTQLPWYPIGFEEGTLASSDELQAAALQHLTHHCALPAACCRPCFHHPLVWQLHLTALTAAVPSALLPEPLLLPFLHHWKLPVSPAAHHQTSPNAPEASPEPAAQPATAAAHLDCMNWCVGVSRSSLHVM